MFDFVGPGGDATGVRSRIKIVGPNSTIDAAGVSLDGVAVVPGAPLTMSCWVIADTLNTLGAPIAVGYKHSTQISSRWSYEIYSSNSFLRARYSTGTNSREAVISVNTAGVTSGVLFHWAASFSTIGSLGSTLSSTIKLYSDGTLRETLAGSISRPELVATVTNGGGFNRTSIGCNIATFLSTVGQNGAENYFNGRIGEVGIWNDVLTDAEVKSLGEGFRCDQIRPQNLKLYMPLAGERQIVSGTDYKASLEVASGGTRPYAFGTHPLRYG
jgi:hypothetical protein